ncbi:hypothetical protein T261_0029 [Streptomyces lydicus]|nr:hypothetical protein T261_0029 [Streptomyces lydicus]
MLAAMTAHRPRGVGGPVGGFASTALSPAPQEMNPSFFRPP